MPHIKDDLQKAISIRDERTVVGAIVGFVLGAFLGWDGLIGILGAVISGYIVYSINDKEVQNYKRIQEMKK